MTPSRLPASPVDGRGSRKSTVKKAAAAYSYRRHSLHDRRELQLCISKLERALEIVELNVSWFDALQQYRSLRRMPARPTAAQFVAAHGVRGPLPIGVRTCARDLDKAFQRIHSYNPEEHLTTGVFSAVQRANAKNSRRKSRDEKLDVIGRRLKELRYKESDDKDSIIDRAMGEFDCGETDVRDAARRAGLTRRYAKTTR